MSLTINFQQLAEQIKQWGSDLGFQQIGITDTDLSEAKKHLVAWLQKKYFGTMDYMQRHATLRAEPDELIPGTLRIISARMDYMPPNIKMMETLTQSHKAYISRYALGRDYHKLIRKRLQKLANKILHHVDRFEYRAFVDSAPVMEKPLAAKAGLGWIGKHTNLINRQAGSWFFLGELFTNLPLPTDQTTTNHCGRCQACLDICPTQAIVAPYQLDARKCISYLTIELRGSIPIEYRALIGNRIYGCDDCQAICPWNRFAKSSTEDDFKPRHNLDDVELITLFDWTEAQFLARTSGSAIRRIGYECWLRNIAVALGNATTTTAIIKALQQKQDYPSAMVREHVSWALQQHSKTSST